MQSNLCKTDTQGTDLSVHIEYGSGHILAEEII